MKKMTTAKNQSVYQHSWNLQYIHTLTEMKNTGSQRIFQCVANPYLSFNSFRDLVESTA